MEANEKDLGRVRIGNTYFSGKELEKECPGFVDWYFKNKKALDKNELEMIPNEVLEQLEANLSGLRRKRYSDLPLKFVRDLSSMAHKYEAVTNLEILPNNLMFHQCCPVCRVSHRDADTPSWIFLSDIPICLQCAERYAPDLLEIVKAANAYYWIKDDDERVSDSHHRMEILAPVLSDEEKVKLWGENWKELLESQRFNDFPWLNEIDAVADQ